MNHRVGRLDERGAIRGDFLVHHPHIAALMRATPASDIVPDIVALRQGILAFWAPMGFKPRDFITIGAE